MSRLLVLRTLSTRPCRRISLYRCFSIGADEEEPEIVLFQRGDHKLSLARSGFFFSSFHTLYWLWYSIDFVPTVNNSPIQDLHIDPLLPMVGLFTASVIQAVFVAYPKRLVSKITWRPKAEQLVLYNYSIPFIRPQTQGRVTPLGEVVLDGSTADAQRLVNDMNSDLRLYRGHLPIGKMHSWPPYLLDIQNDHDVPEPEILLEALMQPEKMVASGPSSEKVPSTSPRKRGKKRRRR